MHEALPSFIQDAKKEGYAFKSLDDLVMEYENIQSYFKNEIKRPLNYVDAFCLCQFIISILVSQLQYNK